MSYWLLAGVAASSALTTAWHHWLFRHREIRSHQELCNHQWGELEEVFGGPVYGPYGSRRFFFKRCPACGEQMHCNEDGSKYVPALGRKDPK